jgi:hypothetical protein
MQPSNEEYNKTAFLGDMPAQVVNDMNDATLNELRQEVKGLRTYVAHLYMAYKELVNIKSDMTTVLQSSISYRDQMAQLALPLKARVDNLEESVNEMLSTLTGE